MSSANRTNLPEEPKPQRTHWGRKVREITPREKFQLQQWEMEYRFVKEVEHLEREGRVPDRLGLERALGFERGGIAAIRLGLRGISLLHVVLLHQLYRGDRDYIMFGQRNKELSAPYIPGVGRIDRYEPYFHNYTSPARWKVGPRPETHPEYYPADPQNTQWTAPSTKSIKKVGKKKEGDEEQADE